MDGLDRATLPFEERYVQAWLGMPQAGMDAELLLNVIKVWGASQQGPGQQCTGCCRGPLMTH